MGMKRREKIQQNIDLFDETWKLNFQRSIKNEPEPTGIVNTNDFNK